MFSNITIAVLAAGLTALSVVAMETQGNTAVPVPRVFSQTNEERQVIDLTNKEREKAGLPALKPNPTLTELARKHSEEMAQAEKLAHTLNSKTYIQRLKEAHYPYLAVGE